MKKILVSACAFLAGASLLLGSVVTNTATEFVPWGDQYRLRLIETIGNMIDQLDNPTPIGPDQMADADHGDVAWASGVASVEAINSVAVATVTAGAAAGATALQPNTVVVTGLTNGVDTAEITVTNGLGAASTIVGIWSATSNGAATSDNLISLVATTGTLLSSTNSGTIVVVTDSTGYAALTATVSAPTTNYAAFIQNNGVMKSSAEMVFDGP